MTGTQLATLIRKKTKTTTATYTDAELLLDVNNVKDELSSLIAKRNEQMFMMTVLDNLVASATTRKYALPTDMLNNIFTIEAALDSAQPTVFVPVLSYPGGLQRLLRNLDGITEAKITNYFTNEQPRYILEGNDLMILSGTITALANGLKIKYRLYPADLANLTGSTDLSLNPTTTSYGIPKNFHELWARRVSIVWKSDRPKAVPLSALELNYKEDLKEQLDAISESDYGEEIIGSLPAEDSPANLGQNV